MASREPKFEDTTPIHDVAPRFEDTIPHVEDHSSVVPPQPKKIGHALTTLLGLGQGATLGTSDEIAGGLNAAKDIVTGKIPLDTDKISDSYVEGRESLRKLQAEAQKENPINYGVSEFAGGFAVPGLGALGKIHKATKALPLLAKLAARTGLGAAAGGALTAASQAGHSEATTPEGVLEDIIKPVDIPFTDRQLPAPLLGAAIGGAVPAASTVGGEIAAKTAGGLETLGERIPLINTIVKPFRKGREGEVLTLPSQLRKASGVAEDTGQFLQNSYAKVKQNYEDLLAQADKDGITPDIASAAKKIENDLQNVISNTKKPEIVEDANKVLKELKNYITPEQIIPEKRFITESQVPVEPSVASTGGLINPEPQLQTIQKETIIPGKTIPAQTTVTPRQGKELQTTLGQLSGPDTTLATPQGKAMAGGAKADITEALDSITGLPEANTKYKRAMEALGELGIDPQDLKPTGFPNQESNVSSDVTKKLLSLIENVDKDTVKGTVVNKQLNNAIAALKEIDPATAAMLQEKIRGVSENLALTKQISGGSGLYNTLSTKLPGHISNILGLGVNRVENAIPNIEQRATTSATDSQIKPEELSKRTYNMNTPQLTQIASKLVSSPSLQSDGAALQKALSTNNSASKNAVLFNLLQKEEGRKVLREMGNF